MIREYAVKEHDSLSLTSEEVREASARRIHDMYGKYVAVSYDPFDKDFPWKLTANSCVGILRIDPEMILRIRPKVPVSSIFRMWKYAWNQEGKIFTDELSSCNTLDEIFERLAVILSRRILQRARRGLYRSYESYTEELSTVRGRFDIEPLMRKPWKTEPQCTYNDITYDAEENRVILRTPHRILVSEIITRKEVLSDIRTAYRMLRSTVTLSPYTMTKLRSLTYTRLNEDYRSIHSLCRFFLDHSGPGDECGSAKTVPFLTDMNALYERFVAEWLRRNLPDNLMLKVQQKITFVSNYSLYFRADLLIIDRSTERILMILDTKYKRSKEPSADDLLQAVAYADAYCCHETVLIYPSEDTDPIDITTDSGTHVRSLVFGINGDFDVLGKELLRSLIKNS